MHSRWLNSAAYHEVQRLSTRLMECRREIACRQRRCARDEHDAVEVSAGNDTSHNLFASLRSLNLNDGIYLSCVPTSQLLQHFCSLALCIRKYEPDQIFEHGRIVEDAGEATGSNNYSRSSSGPYTLAPIVKDLREKAAACPENQDIVDALVDYGDSHLHSGHRGKGISHLRAARTIRDSQTIVKSGQQASREIGMVGARIAAKIDQILEEGHADSEEDYEYDEEDEGTEYGDSDQGLEVPPIVQDVSSKRATIKENQVLVDALMKFGQEELHKRHTGRGTAFLRAARRLRDAEVAVKNGEEAKSIGRIGNKVAEFIDNVVTK